jgi:hypothetical protein
LDTHATASAAPVLTHPAEACYHYYNLAVLAVIIIIPIIIKNNDNTNERERAVL